MVTAAASSPDASSGASEMSRLVSVNEANHPAPSDTVSCRRGNQREAALKSRRPSGTSLMGAVTARELFSPHICLSLFSLYIYATAVILARV